MSTHHKDDHKDDSKEGTACCPLKQKLPASEQMASVTKTDPETSKGLAHRDRPSCLPVFAFILRHKSLLVVDDGMEFLQGTCTLLLCMHDEVAARHLKGP